MSEVNGAWFFVLLIICVVFIGLEPLKRLNSDSNKQEISIPVKNTDANIQKKKPTKPKIIISRYNGNRRGYLIR